jgi:N-acetylglucosaminyl-diphospho-decaprenol L-rhamnosyltransferase
MTTFGVVVVGYESDTVWPEFFGSLVQSTVLPDQIVVVENSLSLPTTIPKLPGLTVTVLHRPDNPGYGASANHGVSQLKVSPDLIVVCNPDIAWQSHTLETLIEEMGSRPTVGIAGPRLLNSDGSTYPSARAFPGIRIGIGHALFGDVWKSNPWTTRYLGTQEGSEPRVVDWLSGACLIIRRETFAATDGFDENYFMFVEDVDLCFRAKKKGWRSLFVPAAVLTHSGAHSTRTRMAEMVKAHHQSMRRFLFRLYERPVHWPIRQALRAGLWVRSVIAPLRYPRSRNTI